MADFIGGVNRVLRINNVIGADDEDITTFSDTQHASDIQLSKIAIQDELAEIVSDRLIPYEKTSATITLLTGTRVYALAADFIRFYGTPSFYDSTDNIMIYEFKGGEDQIKHIDHLYKTTQSTPHWFYWDNTTSKQVGFYYIPNSGYNNRSLSYDYEKSVMVSSASDTLPFHTTEEFYAFASCAARRFFFMLTNQDLGLLTNDATYNNAKTRLYNLIKPTNSTGFYGKAYR